MGRTEALLRLLALADELLLVRAVFLLLGPVLLQLLPRVEVAAEAIVEAEVGPLALAQLLAPGVRLERFAHLLAEEPERLQQRVLLPQHQVRGLLGLHRGRAAI